MQQLSPLITQALDEIWSTPEGQKAIIEGAESSKDRQIYIYSAIGSTQPMQLADGREIKDYSYTLLINKDGENISDIALGTPKHYPLANGPLVKLIV